VIHFSACLFDYLASTQVRKRGPGRRDSPLVERGDSAKIMGLRMTRQIQDIHVRGTEPLIAPRILKAELPIEETMVETVVTARDTIRRILKSADQRLLCIVGPCSIHDPEAAIDYAERLARLKPKVDRQLFIVMRVYFEKPRTTIGWKGLINDPHMDDSCDVEAGLRIARRLLLDINRMGLAAATEMLDPITPQYTADLISWSAIGARTTESQTHREMASGLSMPVGFKNTTDGNLQIAVNAIESARRPHSFLGINQDGMTAIVRTSGNPDAHAVLRGGKTPNFDAISIEECGRLLARASLDPRMVVDCSHAQTEKDYTRQPLVLEALVAQIRAGSHAIMGVMLESNIGAGNQPIAGGRSALKYGVSITDPCIDWPTTERCLLRAAEALESRGAIAAVR
jgi:3-deoxy-7-phosphoheptulonate synthase